MAEGPKDAAEQGGRVFISYRRQDSAWPARQLYEALTARFGAANIFKDVDDIEPGEDFVDKITAAVAKCDVLLALIGPQWMTMADAKGQRRLDDPEDFVRIEIGAALARNVRVIPILIDGAPMPAATELTADLAPMVRRQAVAIDPVSFNTERLFTTLATLFESQRAEAQAAVKATQDAADAERALQDRAEKDKAEREQAEREQAEKNKAEREQAEKDKAEREQAAQEWAAFARREAERNQTQQQAPRLTEADRPAAQHAAPQASGPAQRRTPVMVLVAAGVAVALIATLLIWRPWVPAGTSSADPARPSTSSASVVSTPSASGSSTTGPSEVPAGPDAVWAHRGGLEDHQFETMAAMESAARAGFGVETDVRYTSDGVAVLVHDDEAMKGLDCGGKDVRVSKTTWADLQKTCRSKPTAGDPTTYPVPRFDQTMEAVAAASPSAWVYPEMKNDLSDAQVKKFLAVLIDNGLRGRSAVTSFSRDRLAQVRRLDPTMPTVLLMMTRRVSAAELKDDKLWGVAVEKGIATKQYVQQLQANGCRVTLWLLNDTTQWTWAKTLGADNVMTDFPAKFTEWRAVQ